MQEEGQHMLKNTGKHCSLTFFQCLHTQNVYHVADRQGVRPVPCCILSGSWCWLRSELSAQTHFVVNGCCVSMLGIDATTLIGLWTFCTYQPTAGLPLKFGSSSKKAMAY